MKQKVFTKSIQILIITMLLLAVILPKEYSQKGMCLALLLWITFSLGTFICSQKKYFSLKKLFPGYRKSETVVKDITLEDAQEVFPIQTEPVPSGIFFSDAEINTLFLHLSLRITEKIKSAYPNAVWQWTEKPTLSELLSGTSVRVSVEEMNNFTHADISFDRFGKIHVTPMIVGNFVSEEQSKESSKESYSKEPAIVDVRAWFELVGQRILEDHITELNANGHSKLTIKENGDLVINRHKKESFIARLEAFPGKTYWDELVTVFEENELHAKITGNSLQISWI